MSKAAEQAEPFRSAVPLPAKPLTFTPYGVGDNETTNDRALGENTPVRLALVIAFLGIFGAAVWWASGVQSDLNAIKLSLTSDRGRFANISDLDGRVKMIELYGSPKLLELEKYMRQFERDFELHKAATK